MHTRISWICVGSCVYVCVDFGQVIRNSPFIVVVIIIITWVFAKCSRVWINLFCKLFVPGEKRYFVDKIVSILGECSLKIFANNLIITNSVGGMLQYYVASFIIILSALDVLASTFCPRKNEPFWLMRRIRDECYFIANSTRVCECIENWIIHKSASANTKKGLVHPYSLYLPNKKDTELLQCLDGSSWEEYLGSVGGIITGVSAERV